MSDLHVEAFLASDFATKPVADEELVWKEILVEGEFRHPQQRDRKFKVVKEGQSDGSKGIIAMSDLMTSFQDRAYDQVQIPLADRANADHADFARVNTGFAKKLRTRKRPDGKTAMDAAILFTEEDVKGKCERGTINNCSSGIYFNVEKDDGRKYPAALRHVALTNTNWMSGLKPFNESIALSDETDPADTVSVEFAEDVEEVELTDSGEKVWDASKSLDWLRDKVGSAIGALNGPLDIPGQKYFFLRDLTTKQALVTEETEQKSFVIPFKKNKDEIELAPQNDWTEAETQWVAASDDSVFMRLRALELSAEQEEQETSETDTPEEEVEVVEMSDETEQENSPAPERSTTPPPSQDARNRAAADTPEGRLREAQEKRATLLADNTNDRGGSEMADTAATRAALESLELSDDARSAIAAILDEQREEHDALLSENQDFKQQAKEQGVEQEIQRCKDLGLSENSGFLKQYRRLLLADDGQPAAVLLSEDGAGKKESVTLTEGIKLLVDALPKNNDGKIALSEQHLQIETGDRPNNDTSEEVSVEDQVKEARRIMKLPAPAEVTS